MVFASVSNAGELAAGYGPKAFSIEAYCFLQRYFVNGVLGGGVKA